MVTYAEVASLRIPTWEELHPRTDNDYLYDQYWYSDAELVQEADYWEEMLEEMRIWDIEDAENKALGRKVPNARAPPQPYRESTDFKDIERRVQYIKAIQKRRINNNSQPLPPQSPSFPHLNPTNTAITTSPPDTLAPPPLPPSPNIRYILNRLQFYLRLYHNCLDALTPNHHLHPPDIVAPPPLPLKPNIPRHTHLTRCSRTNISWRGPDVSWVPFPFPLLSILLLLSISPSLLPPDSTFPFPIL
jgi:hypothetical protein